MIDDFGDGLECLGALAPGEMPKTTLTPTVVKPTVVKPSPLPPIKDWGTKAAGAVKTKVGNLPVALGAGGGTGALVGAGLGAWLIRAHRLVGGLVGGLVVGPAVGAALGYGVMKITGKGKTKVKDTKKGGAK
jgi:hypothetical protein